jgi:thioredoxin 1
MKKAIRFTASWCQPCKNYELQWKLVSESRDDWEFVVIDVDSDPGAASRYSIKNIPCTMLENNEEIIFRQTGIINSVELNNILDSFI